MSGSGDCQVYGGTGELWQDSCPACAGTAECPGCGGSEVCAVCKGEGQNPSGSLCVSCEGSGESASC